MFIKQNYLYIRKGIQTAHLGNCTTLAQEDECPTSCGEEKQKAGLVCGSDGNVYKWAKFIKKILIGFDLSFLKSADLSVKWSWPPVARGWWQCRSTTAELLAIATKSAARRGNLSAAQTTSFTGTNVKCEKQTAGKQFFLTNNQLHMIFNCLNVIAENMCTLCRSKGAWLDSDSQDARRFVPHSMSPCVAPTTKHTPTSASWILKTAGRDRWCQSLTLASVESLRRAQAKITCSDCKKRLICNTRKLSF